MRSVVEWLHGEIGSDATGRGYRKSVAGVQRCLWGNMQVHRIHTVVDKSGPVDGAALNATARVLSALCAALQMHLPSPGTHVAIRVIDERLQRTLQPLRFQTRHATRYTVFCDIFGGQSEGNNVPVHEPNPAGQIPSSAKAGHFAFSRPIDGNPGS